MIYADSVEFQERFSISYCVRPDGIRSSALGTIVPGEEKEYVVHQTLVPVAIFGKVNSEIFVGIVACFDDGIYVICGVILACLIGLGIFFAVRKKIRNIY